MKKTIILLSIILNSLCEYPYLFGTSLNTKSVTNGKGINASETTTHSLDDVAQSKSYAHGDGEVNARTEGESLWSNQIHGVSSNANAVQNGNGDSLADSWSKSFTPTKAYYLKNYFSYIQFLNHLFKNKNNENDNLKKLKKILKNKIEENIANYSDPNYRYNGETTFDLQQSRASGKKTSASTSSKTFNWGRSNTIQKGKTNSKASHGWATSNNANWALGKNNYLTTNKNAAAFGKNASSIGESAIFINKGRIYNSGKIWGEALGHNSFTYSNLNGNNFGFGALNGGSNSYSNQGKSISLSEIRGMPYFPEVKRMKIPENLLPVGVPDSVAPKEIPGPFLGDSIYYRG